MVIKVAVVQVVDGVVTGVVVGGVVGDVVGVVIGVVGDVVGIQLQSLDLEIAPGEKFVSSMLDFNQHVNRLSETEIFSYKTNAHKK